MRVIFRVDANNQIGLGHLTRCLALADMISSEFHCCFAMVQPGSRILEQVNRVTGDVMILADKTENAFLDLLQSADIVVLDGYEFNEASQKKIKEKGCKLVFIDDLNQQHFFADVVINHSLNADASAYSTEPYTVVLAGSDYTLLRKEFYSIEGSLRSRNDFKNVFVCLGGSDRENHTYTLASLLCKVEFLIQINILVGLAYNGDIQQLKGLSDKVQVYQDLNAAEIIGLMNKSDFGVVSASGTANECAAAGLPFIAGYYADNQVKFYHSLIHQKNITGIGHFKEIGFDKLLNAILSLRSSYEPQAPFFIDRKQAERYRDAFLTLAKTGFKVAS